MLPSLSTFTECSGAGDHQPQPEHRFALVNPSGQTATVRIELLTSAGQPLLVENDVAAAFEVPIPPGRRFANHIWEMIFEACALFDLLCIQPAPPPLPEMFHGSLRVTSDVPIAVGGFYLLLPEGELLAVPVRGSDGGPFPPKNYPSDAVNPVKKRIWTKATAPDAYSS